MRIRFSAATAILLLLAGCSEAPNQADAPPAIAPAAPKSDDTALAMASPRTPASVSGRPGLTEPKLPVTRHPRLDTALDPAFRNMDNTPVAKVAIKTSKSRTGTGSLCMVVGMPGDRVRDVQPLEDNDKHSSRFAPGATHKASLERSFPDNTSSQWPIFRSAGNRWQYISGESPMEKEFAEKSAALLDGTFTTASEKKAAASTDPLPEWCRETANDRVPDAEFTSPDDGRTYRLVTFVARPSDELAERPSMRVRPSPKPPEAGERVYVRRQSQNVGVEREMYRLPNRRFAYALGVGEPDPFEVLDSRHNSAWRSWREYRIDLPARGTQFCLASSGRYLLSAAMAEGRVSVIDLRDNQLLKTVDLPTRDFVVAGGARHFVVVDRVLGKLFRLAYDRDDDAHDESAYERAGRGRLVGATMGSASAGPLALEFDSFAGNSSTIEFYDLQTLQATLTPIRLQAAADETAVDGYAADDRSLTASPDGQTMYSTRLGFWRWRIQGPHVTVDEFCRSLPRGLELPPTERPLWRVAADGSYLTSMYGLCQVNGVASKVYRPMIAGSDPRFRMELYADDGRSPQIDFRAGPTGNLINSISFRSRIGEPAAVEGALDVVDRYFYSAEEKKLIGVRPTGLQVILGDFDAEGAFFNFPGTRLVNLGATPTTYEPGKKFEYSIRVLTNSEQLQYELKGAPEGMTMSAQGVIEWMPEADSPDQVGCSALIRASNNELAIVRLELRPANSPAVAEAERELRNAPLVDPAKRPAAAFTNGRRVSQPRPMPSAVAKPAISPTPTTPPQVAPRPAAGRRTWNSADGKFTIEAELTAFLNGKAVLKRADGRQVEVPLNLLSEADREFVAKWYPTAGK